MVESLPGSLHTAIKARLDDLQGQPFVPVPAPEVGAVAPPDVDVVLDAVLNEIGLQPSYSLPKLLSEAELSKLLEAPLMPFDPTRRFEQAVPFGLQEYLELEDTMGRAVHPTERGVIPATTPPILTRLGMDAEGFICCCTTSLTAGVETTVGIAGASALTQTQ